MTRTHAEHSHVAEVVPPRDLEASIGTARGMLRALAGEADHAPRSPAARTGTTLVPARRHPGGPGARDSISCARPTRRRAANPSPRVNPELDPAHLLKAERAVVVELRPGTDPALPLRSDWRHDPDPLAGLVSGITPEAGERVISRLTLGPAPGSTAAGIRRRTAEQLGRPGRDVHPRPRVPARSPSQACSRSSWAVSRDGAGTRRTSGRCSSPAVSPPSSGSRLPPRSPHAHRAPARIASCANSWSRSSPRRSWQRGWRSSPSETDVGRLPLLAAGTAARYAAYDDVAGGGLHPGAPHTPAPRSQGTAPAAPQHGRSGGALAPPRPGRGAVPGPPHRRPSVSRRRPAMRPAAHESAYRMPRAARLPSTCPGRSFTATS